MNFRIFSIGLWIASVIFVLLVAVALVAVDAAIVPLLGSMLSRPHLLDRAAPIIILIVFAWVLFEILVKYREVWRQHLAVDVFQAQVAEAAFNAAQTERPALRAERRSGVIVECNSRDATALHETLPAAAAIDASTFAAGYMPLNVYSWALPVLGFIGTASGMATAIAGFKDALGGSNLQIDDLASQLSQSVIPGLATAFETTIFALAATLVTYVCTSSLRGWDQEALDELDRICVSYLSQVPRLDTGQNGSIAAFGEQIARQLQEVFRIPLEISEAAQAMAASAAMVASASEESRIAAGAVSTAAAELSAAGKDLQDYASAPLNITVTRGQSR